MVEVGTIAIVVAIVAAFAMEPPARELLEVVIMSK
jgi:hypothetical protein